MTPRGEDDFERRLFTMIESGDLHFPKGAWRARAEEVPRTDLWEWLRSLGDHGHPRLFLNAVLAYGLALVVSAPVYLSLYPRAEPRVAAPAAPAPLAVGSARRLELGAGPTRANGAESILTLTPGDAFVVLSFLVPIRSDADDHYAATLEDGAGHVVAAPQSIRSEDSLGNFVWVCRSEIFSSGEYVLTVRETSPSRADSPRAHRFPFHVRRAQHLK